MKVHQITEAPRIEPNIGGSASLPKSVDIKPGILDPKGNKTFSVVDQDGKVLKRFSGASAEADANIHRDKLKKQIKAEKPKKPKLTGDPKKDLKATPKDTDLRADKRTKEAKGLFEKLKKLVPEKWMNWFKTHLGRIFGSTIAGWIMKGVAISGIVSLYNSYFDEIYTLVEAKEKGAKADELKAIAKKLGTIRKQLIKETTDLMIGSIGMAFGTGGVLVGSMIGGALLTAVTGGTAAPLAFVVNMLVGAIAAYGAYEGTLMICKMDYVGGILGLDTNIYDYTQNKLGTTWLTPDNLAQTLKEVNASQDFITYILGLAQNPLMQYSSPANVPGINSGVSIGGAAKGAIDAVKGIVDHKDHNELDRIMELSGVVQEKKSTKMKIGDLPDDLKKLVLIGAKTIQKANKENKST